DSVILSVVDAVSGPFWWRASDHDLGDNHQSGSRIIMEMDRRTILRSALSGAAFVAAGGVMVAMTPELAKAVPLAADKVSPIETEDHLAEDHSEVQEHLEQVQWGPDWRRRGWRGPGWRGPRWRGAWARGRRRVCRWRGGRRICSWD